MSGVDFPVAQLVWGWAKYLNVDTTVPDIEPEPDQVHLLGSRYADYALALGFAILLPIIRSILNTYVFQPLGERALTGASKRNDSIKNTPERMQKWKESCWKLTAFTVFTFFALAVSVGEKWFTDSRYFWLGCNHFPPCNLLVSRGVMFFYALETGFYIQSIHFLFFHEVRRKDWLESMIHHWVTTGLLAYSYYVNFTRVGVMVMLVHDICDMWMEAAKLARYCGRTAQANAWFVLFFLSWIVFRLIIFPFHIIRATLFGTILMVVVPHNIQPSPHYEIFNILLLVLLVLHIYWSWLIFKVLHRSLTQGEVADVREEDDD